MKSRKRLSKTIVGIVIYLAICIFLTACGNVSAGDKSSISKDATIDHDARRNVEITEVVDTNTISLANEYSWLSGVISYNNDFIIVGEREHSTHMWIMDSSGTVVSERQLEIPNDVARFPFSASQNNDDGFLVYYCEDPDETEQAMCALGSYDFEGNLTESIPLMDTNEIFYGPCVGMQGEFVFWDWSGIKFYRNQGKNHSIRIPDFEFMPVSVFYAGDVCLAYGDTLNQRELREVIVEESEVRPMCNMPGNTYKYFLSNGHNGAGFINTGDALVSIDKSGNQKTLISWAAISLDGSDVVSVARSDENTIACISAEGCILTLVKTETKEVEKEVITIGALKGFSRNLEKYVSFFNNHNKEYYATIRYYDEPTLMTAELISGGTLDVIELGGIETPITGKYFVNMSEKLLTDENYNNDMILDGLYQAMCMDGALVSLSDSFDIETVVGRPQDVGNASGWTIWEMKNMTDQKGEGYTIFPEWLTNEELMLWVCNISLGQFVNWDQLTCDFANDSFIEYLNLCKSAPKDFYDSSYTGDFDEHVLLTIQSMQSFDWLDTMSRSYGNAGYTYIGFPNDDNNNGSFFTAAGNAVTFAIPQNTQKEEAAWQFVRELLSNEWQGTVDGFPVTKECFEERVAEALSREDLELTDEDISKFLDLINATEVFIHNDIKIIEIILEEAQLYFGDVKTADEVTGIINSRINLYLEEQK